MCALCELATDATARRFKRIHGRELARQVYVSHPYYAINSDILNKILDLEQRQKVDSFRPQADSPHLFTLGYQGVCLEEFLNKLIENSVSVRKVIFRGHSHIGVQYFCP